MELRPHRKLAKILSLFDTACEILRHVLPSTGMLLGSGLEYREWLDGLPRVAREEHSSGVNDEGTNVAEADGNLIDAIVGMREDEVLLEVEAMLGAGAEAGDVLRACKNAMDVVGTKFEDGEFFIPELVMSGEILKQVSTRLKSVLGDGVETTDQNFGTIVFGTVQGDVHDIGKDIVAFMLDVNGFEVVDLGVDVAPEVFVSAIRKHAPQVVGLSGFLTIAFESMKNTIAAIVDAGLRDDVKVMIGGGQVDEAILKYSGADAHGGNAMAAVSLCREWSENSDR